MSEEKETVVESAETPVDTVMETVIHDENEPVVSTKRLLEAGCHFGHQTRRWNPRMAPYIYGARNGIYIIDLVKTAQKIQEAYLALKKIVLSGGKVLFVGTKKQCQEIVQEEALRSGSFYVSTRWLGGTLTNFKTIQKRIRYLNSLETMEEDGSFDNMPKKEAVLLRKEKEKLLKNLDGIKAMRKVPNAIFVADPKLEHNAVSEAHKLRIPVFGNLRYQFGSDRSRLSDPVQRRCRQSGETDRRHSRRRGRRSQRRTDGGGLWRAAGRRSFDDRRFEFVRQGGRTQTDPPESPRGYARQQTQRRSPEPSEQETGSESKCRREERQPTGSGRRERESGRKKAEKSQ